MDSMSGCDIRLVFTFPPKNSSLQYKKCVHVSEITFLPLVPWIHVCYSYNWVSVCVSARNNSITVNPNIPRPKGNLVLISFLCIFITWRLCGRRGGGRGYHTPLWRYKSCLYCFLYIRRYKPRPYCSIYRDKTPVSTVFSISRDINPVSTVFYISGDINPVSTVFFISRDINHVPIVFCISRDINPVSSVFYISRDMNPVSTVFYMSEDINPVSTVFYLSRDKPCLYCFVYIQR